MRRPTRRAAAVACCAALGVGAAGAAWAAWRLTGAGTAQAAAGSVIPLTVTSAGLVDGALTPGNPTAVRLKVENSNGFPVRITDLDLTDLTSTVTECDGKANVLVLNDAPLPPDLTVPAGSEQAPAGAVIVWSGPLRMVDNPHNACQRAGFTFQVTLDAVSAAS